MDKSFMRPAMLLAAACSLSACSHLGSNEPASTAAPESIYAVTADHQLLNLKAGQPQHILGRKPLTGLASGEQLLGIDYRVARGQLYALASSGQLYKLDTKSGALTPVGKPPLAVPLAGTHFGFDFNPVADRIRVVSNAGRNMRLHPDSGAVVDFDAKAPGVQADPTLSYVKGDVAAGQLPRIIAAAYTYNKKDDKLTTNFAIDTKQGTLVRQGSQEGVQPVVSPNTGLLTTIGKLGIEGELTEVSFDIADLNNAAYLAVRTTSDPRTRLYSVDLTTGQATLRGTLGEGAPLLGIAIEP